MVHRFAPSHWRRGRGGRGRLTVPRRATFSDTPAESARGRGSRRGRCPPHGSQGGYRGRAFAPGAGWPWTARGSALSRFSDTPAVSVRGHGNRRGRCRLRGSRGGCGVRDFAPGGQLRMVHRLALAEAVAGGAFEPGGQLRMTYRAAPSHLHRDRVPWMVHRLAPSHFFRHTSCICPRPWKSQGTMSASR